MPKILNHTVIDVTPERFLNACDSTELHELELLLSKPKYQEKMHALNENTNSCRECGFSYDTMVSKDLCVNCWEGIKKIQPKKIN